jgi:hypothetical protein
MVAERRAAATRLADAQAAARANTHRRNIEAASAGMAEAEQCLAQADQTEGLATLAAERQRCENQYPLASFDPWAERQAERLTFTSFLEDADRHRHEHVSDERRRRRGMVSHRPGWSYDGVGPSNAPPPPSSISGADATGEDSADDALF